ncbi:UDP-N-acetylmuramoyl-L-alanyl-D-glutamate--2,6-diaminopimelate ligase [Patescibacteria group bacterium]|nr:UDP-N-acetylmuramoyl-L-alanyl-D-glutamate--2,6-diaminopimelate ligase [Patescibacteria group bacterium]
MFKTIYKKAYHFLIPLLADIYYGYPGKKMIVIGVTGTKGKSTTCRFIASALQAGGHKVGLMSTVEFQIADKRWLNDKKMSMLGKGQIQKMMREMLDAGCEYAVIETSSEGILQHRHLGVHYDIAVFINLGTEHSERHGGFENLRRDKGKLFASLKRERNKIVNSKKIDKISVVNADDPNSAFFDSFGADKKSHYSIKGKTITFNAQGTDFNVGDKKFHLNILGEFNVPNALAAFAVARSQGVGDDKIAVGLAGVKKLEGRMEFVDEGQNFKVIVDYAHEPLSYTELFKSLRKMLPSPRNKVISVIGSDGGGRDIGKREKMGYVAGELCDLVVVTDVNCFDEDPKQIAEMLAGGARKAGKKDNDNLFVIVDRRAGIKKALQMAEPGDVVVMTAKGTEQVICVANGQKIPWDDRTVARELLRVISSEAKRSREIP